jgi:rSAM/selenodomain-associated transferase 1
MCPAKLEPVAVAVLAKAPVPGTVKTRLIPALGAEAAARLQSRLIAQAVETACTAATGMVTLWAAPDATHPLFVELAARHPISLAKQPDGDLGARMLAAFARSTPTLVIGTDCPPLTCEHLREAARHLGEETEAVVIPAEDGGYVLIGLRRPEPALFTDMTWSTDTVMVETRTRLARIGLAWRELPPLWDLDRPEDLERLGTLERA